MKICTSIHRNESKWMCYRFTWMPLSCQGLTGANCVLIRTRVLVSHDLWCACPCMRAKEKRKKRKNIIIGPSCLAHTIQIAFGSEREGWKPVESVQFNFMRCVFMTVSNLILLVACLLVSIRVQRHARQRKRREAMLRWASWSHTTNGIRRWRKANIVIKMTRRDMAN